MRKIEVIGKIGFVCFLIGASSLDGNMAAGAVLTLVGLAMMSLSAKAEGYWR